MIIGREKEIKTLESCLTSDKSELIVTYGRRRIGKTFLIREVYKNKFAFEMTGLYKGGLKDQLTNFKQQLDKSTRIFKKERTPTNWNEAFTQLEKYLDKSQGKEKKILFIDEFPWIASPRSKFLMWFEHFWNSYCTKRNDIVLIICGSAASYMVKNILQNKGGLHNRTTQKIKLDAFTLYETEKFLASKKIQLENYDILQLYMAIGGIPHYLEKIRKGESVAQNIDRLCFEQQGELTHEFNEVFSSLFEDSKTHIEVIKMLANQPKGLTKKQLLEKCKLNHSGYTSKVFNDLIESGFISVFYSFHKKEREAILRLTDEYCLFYMKYIQKNRNQGKGTWQQLSNKQSYKIWSGYAFENICLKHILPIKKGLGIENVYTTHSSWSDSKHQIDLIIERDDHRINLCELKFYNTAFSIDSKYLQELRNKIAHFKEQTKTKKGVYLTMITSYGINTNAQSLSIVENSLTLEALFKN